MAKQGSGDQSGHSGPHCSQNSVFSVCCCSEFTVLGVGEGEAGALPLSQPLVLTVCFHFTVCLKVGVHGNWDRLRMSSHDPLWPQPSRGSTLVLEQR